MTAVVRANANGSPAPSRSPDDVIHPSLLRADTILADVEGLLHNGRPIPGAAWPLVDALRQAWGAGKPLVWLVAPPTTEIPALEKSRLVGTTVRVDASMGTTNTIATWTDVSRQAAANTSVLGAIADLLDAQVAGDTDRAVGTLLAALAAFTPSGSAALRTLAPWPGPRLIVLAPNGVGELRDWQAYAAVSGGAVRVIADPYITQNLCIALAGVALGVVGTDRLTADQASHLGVDVSSQATWALEVANGAVQTWISYGGSSGGGPPAIAITPTLVLLTPDTATAGTPSLQVALSGTNFVSGLLARTQIGLNPPTTIPAQYISATEATMMMPTADMLNVGVVMVSVLSPTATPPESNALPFTVTAPPTPVITRLIPETTGMGSADDNVTVIGSEFLPTAIVQTKFGAVAWADRVTTYISDSVLRFVMPASEVDQAGTVDVRVQVPQALPSEFSNTLPYEVVPPLQQPILAGISPDYGMVGTTGQTVRMTGEFFASPMTARLGTYPTSTEISCVVIDEYQADFLMPDNVHAAVGTSVTVQANVHQAVPPTSDAILPYRVTAAPPTILTIDPPTFPVGATLDHKFAITGTEFQTPMSVTVDGTLVPATRRSSTTADFMMPAAMMQTVKTLSIGVFVSFAEPQYSAMTVPLNIVQAPYVATARPNFTAYAMGDSAAGMNILVNGAGFSATSRIMIANSAQPTRFVSASELWSDDRSWYTMNNLDSLYVDDNGATVMSNRVPFYPSVFITSGHTISPMQSPDSAGSVMFTVTAASGGQPAIVDGMKVYVNVDPLNLDTYTEVGPITPSGTARPAAAGTFRYTVPTTQGPIDFVVGERDPLHAPDANANTPPMRVIIGPLPTLTLLDPDAVTQEAAEQVLTCHGTNFDATCIVYLDDVAMVTTYVSPTEVTALINPDATGAPIMVKVGNSIGAESNELPLTVTKSAPILTSISPTSMFHHQGAITLTATGSNFTPDCRLYIRTPEGTTAQISGSTVVSATQMTGSVDMGAKGTGRPYQVYVQDGLSQKSAEKPFVSTYAPTLSSINPTQMYYEDGPQRLNVTGTNFFAGMKINLKGWYVANATVVNTTTAYTDGVDPGVGTVQIQVGYQDVEPDEWSNEKPLTTVNKPKPTITNATGDILWDGTGTSGTVTLTGTGFVAPMTVTVTGSLCSGMPDTETCTVVSPTQATYRQTGHSSSQFPHTTHSYTATCNGIAGPTYTGSNVNYP